MGHKAPENFCISIIPQKKLEARGKGCFGIAHGGGVLRGRFDDCFVGLSFPQAPVTFFIIILYFESPATTFDFVKATRLTAI